jgi:hypothetical protein
MKAIGIDMGRKLLLLVLPGRITTGHLSQPTQSHGQAVKELALI